ncbi:MAG TPA: hypothetical protein PLT12_05505 [Kiritimatiellia bacterium]|jgi:hypothetical protein|nr:MAG: hypothetical protein BWX54_00639 [Verrucomicrobia bacterium ADurb.Bin018]HOE00183.1 hypothetical protein [Kiritimatiellia bacterium]HOE36955.1 hypothetical protein [Kiritimatiellia bacterium]HOR74299.1 hypothetical protein [Kiritimatiellia bacterium]HOU59858.1 hypothetical protein [Kiritimatiellia bacterium]
MWLDIKYEIEKSQAPEIVKLSLNIVTKAISWFPWIFVVIGFFLPGSYFTLWLGFFLLVEGGLILALIYMLVLLVHDTLTHPPTGPISPEERREKESLAQAALKGIIGNIAFYIFILVAFIVIKSMGITDKITGIFLNK